MFRFGQRLSQILGKGAVPLTPEEVSLLDHYDLELEDALSTGVSSAAFPNSWLNASATQFVFIANNDSHALAWNLSAKNGSDLAINGSDSTIIDILTDGYYLVDYWARVYQTASPSTTVGLVITGGGPNVADSTSVAYTAVSDLRMVIPAGYPQNVTVAAPTSFGPFKAAVGDTIGASANLFIGTLGDNFTIDASLSAIRVA